MCKDCGCPAGGDDVKIFKVEGEEQDTEHTHEHEEQNEQTEPDEE